MDNHLRFLSQRIKLFAGAALISAVLLALFAYLAGRFASIFFILAWNWLALILIVLPLTGYYWIYRPYCATRDSLRRFIEGYISVHELRGLMAPLSPEIEQFIASIDGAMESMRNLDLSKRQAQYRALQNQINPHFLYNTLEGIRSEALIAGLDSLADMTEALAAVKAARMYIVDLSDYCSDDTYRFVIRRENEITLEQCEKNAAAVREAAEKAI